MLKEVIQTHIKPRFSLQHLGVFSIVLLVSFFCFANKIASADFDTINHYVKQFVSDNDEEQKLSFSNQIVKSKWVTYRKKNKNIRELTSDTIFFQREISLKRTVISFIYRYETPFFFTALHAFLYRLTYF